VVRATEVTRVATEEGGSAGPRGRGHGVNQVLDDALGAFIEVLDRHTIADMVRGRSPSEAPTRGKTGTATRAALMGPRARRTLHGG
jgi:Rrf2 family nitric oxide-sensitive transcriptional repressor